MPKSWSLRASMPIRTASSYLRGDWGPGLGIGFGIRDAGFGQGFSAGLQACLRTARTKRSARRQSFRADLRVDEVAKRAVTRRYVRCGRRRCGEENQTSGAEPRTIENPNGRFKILIPNV